MSNLFGGGAKVASMTPTQAMGIQFMSSQYGPPVPVVYGTGKVGGNCMWYGDFTSTAHSQKTGKGGGGSSNSSYTYSASFQLGLCEGPITSIGTVYDGTSTVSLSSVGAVTATGTPGQAPWSHLSGAFALGYSQTSWIAVQNLQLGSSASLPNWNVEVTGLHPYSGSQDANPADILTDICTDTSHGINFPYLGSLTQFSDYCVATGMLLSPVYDQEQTAQQTLDDLFKYTNSAAFFSEGVLKVAPYGDTAVTGNGVTYTPNNSPLVNLGTADYLVSPGEDPIQITRKAPSDAMNMVRVQFQDRTNSYHDSVVVASIDEDVIQNGGRADTTEDVDMCKVAATARFIAQNLVQRSFFIRNTYEFKLGWRYCYLEPMDIVTLSDANTGLSLWPVRIVDITEDESGDLAITAEEYPEGVGHSAIYNTQPNNGGSVDPNADPGAVNPPYIFRGPGFLVSNANPEIWLATCGSNDLWGGADIYLSHDGTSYSYVGTVAQPARYGALTTALPTGSDPDTTNTPEVTVYAPAQLLGGSQADADNLVTLAMVDTELVSYETSTLVGTDTYQLGYLRRGTYGSTVAAHSAGAPFVRLDDAIFRLPIDPSMIGQTVYIKFLSINAFGRTPRTLAGETAYTYVVGTNVELPDVPPVPASFGTQGVADGVSITWNNSNPSAVGCTSIERSTTATGPWTVIAQVGPTTTGYTDHFTNGALYYYRARARGPLVSSGWSAYTSVFNSTGTNVNAIANTANTANGSGSVINPNFAYDMSGWYVTKPANFYQENGSNNPNPFTTTYMVHKGTAGQTFDAAINDGFVNVAPGQVVVGNVAIEAFSTNSTAFAMTTIRFYDINKNAISGYPYSTIQVGTSQPYIHANSRVSAVAPANAAFASIGVDYHNHTSGYINVTCAILTPQVSSVDEVPDGTNYLRQTLVSGTAISIPNSIWQMPLDAQGNIPGWTLESGGMSLSTASVQFGKQSVVLSATPSVAGSLRCNTQYKVIPGDYVAVEGWCYAVSGTKCCLAANFQDANGNYISDIEAQNTGGWAQVQAGGVVPANAATMYLQAYLYKPASGTAFAYFNEIDVKINDLRTAGSGARIGDQRNLPAITFSNYGSGWSGLSLSYTSTTTSATITASAATLIAGSVSINYNASSATVSGSPGTSYTYYLYYQDPTHAGGSCTLLGAGTQVGALRSDANVYIAAMTVTFPSSGSGGGGGGGACPLRTAWVIRRGRFGRPQYVRAAKVRAGDFLRLIDGTWGRVIHSEAEEQPCVRVVVRGSGTLGCSVSAPLRVKDGDVLAADALGRRVLVKTQEQRYCRVSEVRDLGMQWVQHISMEGPIHYFWTGDAKDCLFAHHNIKPP